MTNRISSYGAIHALLAVALGAFGAHGLKESLEPDMLAVFETGVRYHMYHALGLLLIGLLAGQAENGSRLVTAGRLVHGGIFLFSGSLYALSLSGITWLGAITPVGGLLFLGGWALTAAALWGNRGGRRAE